MFFLQVRSIWNGSNPWCYLCFASKYCQWKSLCFSMVLVGYFVGFNRSFGDLSHGVYGKLIWNKTEILFSPWNWYRVRQCNFHPSLNQLFQHQLKCCTKNLLKIFPGIWKSSLKISRKEIGKNFSVFSVIRKFWKILSLPCENTLIP